MLQGSNDNSTWTNLWTAASNPLNLATTTTINGNIALTNANSFTVSTNAAPYRFYRIYGVAAANVLAGIATEIYFDVNKAAYNPSNYAKLGTCIVDTSYGCRLGWRYLS